MKANKYIQRDEQATKIFDNRSLANDYRNLAAILKPGMKVLDVGCGTGAISKDIAVIVGANGKVTGIDNTESFILSGKESYKDIKNLELNHVDLFDFHPEEKFDLIVAIKNDKRKTKSSSSSDAKTKTKPKATTKETTKEKSLFVKMEE